mmetsp:Transcript_31086/g.81421  ORF Transcript_31086/g.81421 Transcript_31086/m.81421 type:complete len:432 (-) Transcript_31086:137-1432(-)|eukprot:CAMPEP_0182916842 /NCGR_PEP_ID=MMETSP0105_2-20130417/1175_1 /TAXON_ID=81532 ORGANISM="Acanthoeca-like sp., Strain 10tr" /NCGR_SAMPLE_ID=MMETSP0105_2 /ASSEMBLY_ACC=CAM_ASM_000205 /LENGTH=431 /DNA_ID=CAMNT_0025053811 /DNA_START=120 /DNA_END=1415 /DNA_ORIENTATION=-
MAGRIPAVIVGGGAAGVGASIELKRLGVKHVLLERGRLFNAWRFWRWDGFKLNTPMAISILPGQPAMEGDDKVGEPIASVLAKWDAYVSSLNLPVREGVEVLSIKSGLEAETFELSLRDALTGSESKVVADAVVVASGAHDAPRFPQKLTQLSSQIPKGIAQLAPGSYTSPAALPDGNVLVVGSGQTGSQLADEISAAGGRKVYMATSKTGGCPRSHRGMDLFLFLDRLKFFEHSRDAVPEEDRSTARPGLIGANSNMSYYSLYRQGVSLLGSIESVDDAVLSLKGNLADNVVAAQEGYDTFQGILRGIVAKEPEWDKALPVETPDERWEKPVDFDAAIAASPATLDLAEAGITSVVWGTGWTHTVDFVEVPKVRASLGADGLPTTCEPPGVTGFYWLGFEWIRTRGSALLVGARNDATFVAEQIAATLKQ